jgi:hypothetical protein
MTSHHLLMFIHVICAIDCILATFIGIAKTFKRKILTNMVFITFGGVLFITKFWFNWVIVFAHCEFQQPIPEIFYHAYGATDYTIYIICNA